MAFQNMIQETLGTIPGINLGLAKTFINQAFQKIQDEKMWSFQTKMGNWLSPGILGGFGNEFLNTFIPGNPEQVQGDTENYTGIFLSPGLITVYPYTTQITGDAVASSAWWGASSPTITSYQVRSPYYSLYNIVSIEGNGQIGYVNITSAGTGQVPGTYVLPVLDSTGPGTGATVSITVTPEGTVTVPPVVVTQGSGYLAPYISFNEGGTPAVLTPMQIAILNIDRPWGEPVQVNAGYMAYQAYFPTPKGFKRFYYIVDTTDNYQMNYWSYTQKNLAELDPERTDFAEPEYVVYWGPDTRAGSPTFGQILWELWEGPITELPYTWLCQCDWPLLVNPTDTVPFPLTEELVKFRTYEVAALWKEAQKGDNMERGSGSNWQFLAQAFRKEYEICLKPIIVKDRNIMDLYFSKKRNQPAMVDAFVSVTSQLNVGG